MSPLGALWRGLVTGVAGTIAMDALWYWRYRKDGGTAGPLAWEFQAPDSWESAPAPAQVGRRLAEGSLGRPLPRGAIGPTTVIMHWGYGSGWGAVFGLVADQPSVAPSPGAHCSAAGSGQPITRCSRWAGSTSRSGSTTSRQDLSAHLVYGTTTGLAFNLLRVL